MMSREGKLKDALKQFRDDDVELVLSIIRDGVPERFDLFGWIKEIHEDYMVFRENPVRYSKEYPANKRLHISWAYAEILFVGPFDEDEDQPLCPHCGKLVYHKYPDKDDEDA